MNINTNITESNAWFLKRVAISATYFFGCTERQRKYAYAKLAKVPSINGLDDLRKILGVPADTWAWFLDNLSDEGCKIRKFNGKLGLHDITKPLQSVLGESALKYTVYSTATATAATAATATTTTDNGGASDKEKAAWVKALTIAGDELTKARAALDDAITEKAAAIEARDAAIANAGVSQTLRMEIVTPEHKTITLDTVHKTMPSLLRKLQCGLNVYLVGPAGSGKTTAAEQAAEGLGLDFGFMSVGPQTTKSDVFGFMAANGNYVETEFRRRYEQGGVFLFDEIDAANAGVLTQINAALAGSVANFPDKMVRRHKDFRCVAAGNTYGSGATRKYIGRNKLDAASLDRFVFINWDYDEALELSIVRGIASDEAIAVDWFNYVRQVRHAVDQLGMELVVSPRATFSGAQLLCVGEDRNQVESEVIFKHLRTEEVARVREFIRTNPTPAPVAA